MAEFRMPSLGADMASGTLVQWLVEPGEAVERGDIVAEVETQKGVIDIEIFADGTISKLLVEEGTEVPVGTPLAILNGEEPEEAVASGPSEVAAPEAPAPTVAPVMSPVAAPSRERVSPLARKRAGELGVDLASVTSSQPDGVITVADIEAASAHSVEPAAAADPTTAMRQAIAKAMSRSNQEIPHYYLQTDIDMSATLAWIEKTNAVRPVTARILPAALLIKAVARAVSDVPEMNGWMTETGFHVSADVHVGVAISLRNGGLVAPAIHGVEALSPDEVMGKLHDLILRARSGKLRSSEISEPTITVTNLGDQGVPVVFGVIYPPQVAIVGFGKTVPRPWVTGNGIEARPIITATLSADHRVSDGHRGGLFLSAIERWLQNPEEL